MATSSLSNLTSALASAQRIIIALSPNALLDHVTASLALAHGLTQQGKHVSLLGSVPEFDFSIPSIELIKPQVQGRDLIISWPDPDNSVTQVMTETQADRGRFALIIETKPDGQPIDVSQLEFTYSRVDADLILLAGTDLKSISNPDVNQLIKQRPQTVIRLSTTENFPPQPNIQDVSLSDAPSLSFVSWQIFQSLKLKLDKLTATLMLLGLEHRTERFANPNLSAEVFLMIAQCLNAGGVRNTPNSAPIINQPPSPASSPPPTSLPPSSQTPLNPKPTPAWINPPNIDQTARRAKKGR